jgi:hypothetical protein
MIWNGTGLAGSTGSTGPTGPQGPTGPTGMICPIHITSVFINLSIVWYMGVIRCDR